MGGLTGMPSDTALPRELGVPSSEALAGGGAQNPPMNADGRGRGLVSHHQPAWWGESEVGGSGHLSAWSPGMAGLQGILGGVDTEGWTSGDHAMTTTCPEHVYSLYAQTPRVLSLCLCANLPPSLGISGRVTQGWEQSPI